ncbi:MAG: hypothetical protein ACREH9_06630, partial [Pseudomonadota bacterium]
MMSRNKLRWINVLAIGCLLAPYGLEGRSKPPRKVDKLISAGQKAELVNDWDKALDLYLQAVAADPSDIGAQLFMRRARFQAGQR